MVDELEHVLLMADVERGGRLVEHQQAGVLHERTRDQHPLPLTTGQRADVATGELADAERVQCLGHELMVTSAVHREAGEVWRAAEERVLGDADRIRHDRVLRDHRNSTGPLTRPHPIHCDTVDLDATHCGHHAGKGLQERALAGTVRTDDPEPLPSVELERHPIDDETFAERDADVLGDERGHDAPERFVRRTMRKNGAPINAVITPIGSSAGLTTVRARRSVATRNAAPRIMDIGRIRR